MKRLLFALAALVAHLDLAPTSAQPSPQPATPPTVPWRVIVAPPSPPPTTRRWVEMRRSDRRAGAAESAAARAERARLLAEAVRPGPAAQWRPLPEFVKDVYAGPSGRVWLQTQGGEFSTALAEVAAEVAKAAKGEAAGPILVAGGRVLLIDSSGRAWGAGENSPWLLRGTDGKTWTYRRADGRPVDLSPTDPDAADDYAAKVAFEWINATADRRAPNSAPVLSEIGAWYGTGVEDAAGRLHFLGGSPDADAPVQGFGVHTLHPATKGADGKAAAWTFSRLFAPSVYLSPYQVGGFVPHPDGQVTLNYVDAVSDARPQADLRMFLPRYDGFAWRWIEPAADLPPAPPSTQPSTRPAIRPAPPAVAASDNGLQHLVTGLFPLPDGRVIATTYTPMRRQGPTEQLVLRRYAAPHPEKFAAAAELPALLAELDAPNLPAGDAAAAKLRALGPDALPALHAALDDAAAAPPQRAARLVQIIADLEKQLARDATGTGFYGPVLPTPRARPTLVAPDGTLTATVELPRSSANDTSVDPAIVTVAPDGTWKARSLPLKQWKSQRVGADTVHLFRARTGVLWREDGIRFDPAADAKADRTTETLNLETPVADDAGGRVYARGGGRWYVYVPAAAAPTAAPATRPSTQPADGLTTATIGGVERIAAAEGAGVGWAVQGKNLLRLDGPVPTAIPLPDEVVGKVQCLVPLRGRDGREAREGVILVLGSMFAEGGAPVLLWDGKMWDPADTLWDLVKRRADWLAKTAGDSFEAYGGMNGGGTRLAADGAGGLWFAQDVHAPLDPRADPARRSAFDKWLMHYDGKWWHDVWPLLGAKQPGPVGDPLLTFDGGRRLAVGLYQPGAVWEVYRDPADAAPGVATGLAARKVYVAPNPDASVSGAYFADGTGGLWSEVFGVGPTPGDGGYLRRYADGQMFNATAVPEPLTFEEVQKLVAASGSFTRPPPGPPPAPPADQPDMSWGYRLRGRPLLADADGRVWGKQWDFYLWVRQPDGGVLQIKPEGLTGDSRLIAAGPARAWLLGEGGLVLLEARASATTPPPPTRGRASPPRGGQLVELARWPWPGGPRNTFAGAFVDAHRGLWLPGVGARATRVQLPPTPPATTRPATP